MIIKPRTRGFICTTAHPVGCKENVKEQVKYVQTQPSFAGPKNVLIIGGSTGYGLASRIVASFGGGANTISVYRSSTCTDKRTASPGVYHSLAFEQQATAAGLLSLSITGDAFCHTTKQKTINLIRTKLGKVDMVVYSVAAARRTDPNTEQTFQSVLKTIGQPYRNKTVDFHTGHVSNVLIDPATDKEIFNTVKVMGGEDWSLWIDALEQAEVLADNVTTIAFSYMGPELTHAIYRNGTIGQAKLHLETTAKILNKRLAQKGGCAYVVISKALVTQSSSAIPVVPLYISALYKIMKGKNIHEKAIEQMYRLFSSCLFTRTVKGLDEQGRIRIDDLEMREDVQREVAQIWSNITTHNIHELCDLSGYRRDFFQLFGFEIPTVDYEIDVDPKVMPPSYV